MSIVEMTRSEVTSLVRRRRLRTLATIDQFRLVATALFLFFLADYIRLTLTVPIPLVDRALMTMMDVLAYIAVIVGLWRPRLGLAVASIPLAAALFWMPTSLEVLLLVAIPALALTQLGARPAVWVSLGFLCYVIVRIVTYGGGERGTLAVVLAASLALGLCGGWTGHTIRQRRERAERTAVCMATEDARIRADERRTLSADLHDVVVHHLSTASLHLMAGQESEDTALLKRALRTAGRANAAALGELRLLVRVLRDDPATGVSGTEVRELAERESPTQAAAQAERALTHHGFEPCVHVPAIADDLNLTVQRTVARLIRVVVDNQIRHAPDRGRCSIELNVSEHQVTLQARNPMPSLPQGEEPRLGWGLKGVRARIDLTGGTMTAGPVGDEWVVTAVLPLE